MDFRTTAGTMLALAAMLAGSTALAAPPTGPAWSDRTLTPEVRAASLLAAMTEADKFQQLVGAAGVEAVLPYLATGARVVVIGVGAGARAQVDLLAIMGARATLGGSTLRARTTEEKAEVAWLVESRAVHLLGTGAVRVPVAATFPMADATAAYDRFAEGGKLGKIVLVNEA